MCAMRCLYGALGCLAWVIVVYAALGDTLGVIRSSYYTAISGVLVLPPTAALLAIFDGAGLARWKRVIAICVGVIVPAAVVLLVIAFLSSLNQITF